MFQPAHGQTGASATQRWYDEIDDYDFSTHQSGTGKPTGHFTQVVWYGSTHVGAARSSDGIYIAANYSPPGNTCWGNIGHHPENVFPRNTPLQPSSAEKTGNLKEASAWPMVITAAELETYKVLLLLPSVCSVTV